MNVKQEATFNKLIRNIFSYLKDNTTLLITGLSAIGYLGAYMFNAGQIKYYGLSDEFVDIGLIQILRFSLIGALAIMIIMIFISSLLYFFEAPKWGKFFISAILLLAFESLIILGFHLNYNLKPIIFAVIIYIVLTSVLFFYYYKINSSDDYSIEANRIKVKKSKMSSQFMYAVFTLEILFSLIILFNILGMKASENRKHYWVLKNKPNTVIIEVWHDQFLCRTYNIKTNIYDDSVFFINAKEIKYSLLNKYFNDGLKQPPNINLER